MAHGALTVDRIILNAEGRLVIREHMVGSALESLEAVARHGFATGYSGIRIAKSGRRFLIEKGVVWQLIDRDGAVRGQAATFARWRDA